MLTTNYIGINILTTLINEEKSWTLKLSYYKYQYNEELRAFLKGQLDEEITSMSRYIVSLIKKDQKRVERIKG